MQVFNHVLSYETEILKYFNNKNVCFLDIETTGLSRKYNQVYLIGLVYFDRKLESWFLKQIFADNVDEEKAILKKLNTLIGQFDLIVTYNGVSFDLPFIYYRSKKYCMDSNILNMENFDIYREIRVHRPYLHLKNLKLKTIEEELGIYREDKYSGKDCISFYYQYVNSGDELLKGRILKHNYDDLYYLLDIMNIFDHIRAIKSMKFEYENKTIQVSIIDIMEAENILKINCITSKMINYMDIIYYDKGFNINWTNGNSLIIDLEFKEGLITPTKKCFFLHKADLLENSNLASLKSLEDFSEFMVPNNIILLKVENRYQIKNIKNIIKYLLHHVLLDQTK